MIIALLVRSSFPPGSESIDSDETINVLFPPAVRVTGAALMESRDNGPGDAAKFTLPPVTTTTGPNPLVLSGALNVATPAWLTKTPDAPQACDPPKLAMPRLTNVPF